jgi:membrane protease YdiL (CAAX protease family)
MIVLPGPIGQTIFTCSKVWLVVFPTVWWLGVERGRVSWSPARRGGLGVGAIQALVLGSTIFLAYWLIGRPGIDVATVRATLEPMGLMVPGQYLAGATYWVLGNSLIEEYVYRWFILRQCERLMPGPAAIVVSALVFTAHHVVAMASYLPPGLTALASTGVLIGGLLWAWCYLRYRSIWPGWISHLGADVGIFVSGWHLLFVLA